MVESPQIGEENAKSAGVGSIMHSREADMKKSADVVIIGGGIIGCCCAYFLARRIKDVVLVERKGIAAESSGANYGMIWQQTGRPGFDLAMRKRGIELYDELTNKEVFDIDIEYEKKGGMTIFFTEIQIEAAERFCRAKQSLGIPVRVLGATEVRKLEPALSEEVAGSTYCPEEAQLNPMYTTIAFARAAKKEGATIYTGTEVHSIKLHNGSVGNVVTNRGEIKTKFMINAAGSWASHIGEMVGLKIPVYPHRLQSVVTEQVPRLVNRTLQGARVTYSPEEAMKSFSYAYDATGGKRPSIYEEPPLETLEEGFVLYIKPTISGNIVLGAACDFAGYDRNTSYEGLGLIAASAKKAVPQLKNVQIIRSWANFDPWTADGIPIVGETEVKGFIIAAGHGTGMSHGPAAGEAVAALIVDGKPIPYAEQASIARFTK